MPNDPDLRAALQTGLLANLNTARLAVFRRNADVIKGVRYVSTMDSNTSLICIAYSGGEWDLNGCPINGTKLPFNGGPPHHFDCRSVLVPITKTFRDLGIDVDEPKFTTRASDGGQIAGTISYDEFLQSKSREYIDQLLGVGRADLWVRRKLTCRDFLSDQGTIMSLDELRAKFDDQGEMADRTP